MRLSQAVLASLVTAGVVGGVPAIGVADDKPKPPIVVSPGDQLGRTDPPAVGIDVTAPGHPGGAGSTGRAAVTGGGSACGWVLAPDVEAWLRRLPARLPGGGMDRVDRRSRLYQRVCDGLVRGWAWLGP
ncbi:MAG TPA: hypothetical protein VK736_07025, partial [Candidatus Binatia bacterium]|nr:hypothetical protein [Candidatus Binatia bacterium]